MFYYIAFLNVFLSINHKNEFFYALIEAALGAEYSNANYPKHYPGSIFL
jgi:hypothetical protein